MSQGDEQREHDAKVRAVELEILHAQRDLLRARVEHEKARAVKAAGWGAKTNEATT